MMGFAWLRRRLARLIVWLGELIGWIWELPILGIVLAVFIMVISGILLRIVLDTCVEQEIRLSGLLFQVFGVITVLWKARAAKKKWQSPSTLTSIRQWWQRRPPLYPINQVIGPMGANETGDDFFSASAGVSPSPGTPLKERVERLEQHDTKLFAEIGRLDQKIANIAQGFAEHLKAERAERQKADKQNEEGLKEQAVGTLHLDYAGAFYLIVGILLATASIDIAGWLGAPPCK
jgi:hypothetical protein